MQVRTGLRENYLIPQKCNLKTRRRSRDIWGRKVDLKIRADTEEMYHHQIFEK